MFCPSEIPEVLPSTALLSSTPIVIPAGAVFSEPRPDLSIAVGYPDLKCPFCQPGEDTKGTTSEHGLTKYWYQRFSLFSRFEEGVMTDRQGLFSACPEVVSHHIAQKIRSVVNDGLIVDCTASIGGNSLTFALGGPVIAIDIDDVKLLCLRNNAVVYDCDSNIDCILGDCCVVVPTLRNTEAIFIAPEWCGPSYSDFPVYKPSFFKPNLIQIASMMRVVDWKILVLSVPNNISLSMIVDFARLIDFDGTVDVEQNVVNGKLKLHHIYFIKK
ncbi:hypothetical protein GEMRC1_003368 [Eukaryota sp. GEM-RC1]